MQQIIFINAFNIESPQHGGHLNFFEECFHWAGMRNSSSNNSTNLLVHINYINVHEVPPDQKIQSSWSSRDFFFLNLDLDFLFSAGYGN